MKLSFEFPTNEFLPFIKTLDNKFQELIWKEEYEAHLENVAENFEEELGNLRIDLERLKENRKTEKILNYLPEDEDENSELSNFTAERTNPYTGESLSPRPKTYSEAQRLEAIAIVDALIKEHEEIIADPKPRLAAFLWEYEVNEYHQASQEEYLLNHLNSILEYQEIMNGFHAFYGRDPENERIKAEHLEAWWKAQESARRGDDSLILKFQRLTPEAEGALASGKRITKQPGDCYVCKKFVLAYNGELLIWNEIPEEVRDSLMPGVRSRWHVRHFNSECSDDALGKRIPVLHLRDHTGWKNEKADTCWVCGVQVDIDQGQRLEFPWACECAHLE